MREGYQGTQTLTKTLGHHIIIETIMDIFKNKTKLTCYLTEVPTQISIE